VLSCSDSRTLDTDVGGALVAELAIKAGFVVSARDLVPDDVGAIRAWIGRQLAVPDARPDALLITGGTGISGRDGTVEAVKALLEKELPGYGELFRWLSFQEVGAAAMLSRALAGTIGATAVFVMPGSPGGVRLAMEKLILPELTHVASELRRHAGRATETARSAMTAATDAADTAPATGQGHGPGTPHQAG
jgi:molybdenum cofactor biosynthesis protein B